ncbi:hypothetical protein QBC34DRAFT_111548 [Podospora aff. communis PSN243]|uniref:Uncharacterized protein n=1 Tax=Podospora aff. communis PSN243 TaxID=3040156 RepID=A0AAV9GKI7_9PEZI|nr:hypothetical protein QBC34DRAFT_111548 [Podospora aff. communis PSN243]
MSRRQHSGPLPRLGKHERVGVLGQVKGGHEEKAKLQKRPNGTVPIEMPSSETVRSGPAADSVESSSTVGCCNRMPAHGSWSLLHTREKKQKHSANVTARPTPAQTDRLHHSKVTSLLCGRDGGCFPLRLHRDNNPHNAQHSSENGSEAILVARASIMRLGRRCALLVCSGSPHPPPGPAGMDELVVLVWRTAPGITYFDQKRSFALRARGLA